MKTISWLILLLATIVLLVILYNNFTRNNGITPEEARKRIDENKYDYVIDVRTKEEWSQGHHPRAISIPIGELVSALPIKVQNKDARILIVCRKGIRSKAAASIAKDIGYTNVEYVSGMHNGLR